MISYNVAPLASDLLSLSEKLKEHCILQLEAREQSAPDPLHSGIEYFTRASSLFDEMGQIEGGILTNKRLSELGRKEEMRKLANEYRDKLTFLATAAKEKRAAAAKLEKEFRDVPKGITDPTVDYLVGREIRQHLAQLPMLKRRSMLLEATPTTQKRILRAISSDPLDTELMDPELVRRIQEEHAKNPDGGKEWNRMETLIFVAERLEQLTAWVEAQLSRYDTVPTFPGKPTRTTDLAYTDTQAPPDKNRAVDKTPTNAVFV